MNCDEAAEFVSALYDGDTIPHPAAEHIATCASCQARLREYIELGVELRRAASLEIAVEVKNHVWNKRLGGADFWWRKGWETMRIPKLALVLLLVGVAVLTSGLTLVGVRARTQESALMLRIASEVGRATPCPLSFEDKRYAACDMSSSVTRGSLNYEIRLLSREGDRVELGVRTKFAPGGNSTDTFMAMKNGPERQFWLKPGKPLQIDVDGYGPVTVTGEWLDHIPYFAGIDLEHNLQPHVSQLRAVSPMLLKGDRVVSDWKGGSASSEGNGAWAIYFYVPKDGLYVLSQSSMQNAVQGHVADNRVSFQIDGQQYQLITAAPITQNDWIWVSHLTNVPNPFGDSDHPGFGTSKLDKLLSSMGAGN